MPTTPTAKVNLALLDQGAIKDDADFEALIKAVIDGAPVNLEVTYAGKTITFPAPQVREAAVDVARIYTPGQRWAPPDEDVEPRSDKQLDAAVARLGDLVGV